jgi:glutamate-1-semialdehyde 2,1-aminomutase
VKLALYTDSLESRPLDEALELAGRTGVAGVELGGGGPASRMRHLDVTGLLESPARRAALRAQLATHSLDLCALNCSLWPLHPVHGQADEQTIRDTFRLAGELGVETVVSMSGCPGDGPAATTMNWVTYPWPADATALLAQQWSQVIALWIELAEEAARCGVRRIAIELHPLHLVYSVPTLLRLRSEVGPIIGVNLDPSHLFWQGMDPIAVARELGEAVHHVHLKDTVAYPAESVLAGVLDTRPFEDWQRRSWTFCTVGRGHGINFWEPFLNALAEAGYDGALAIENEDPQQGDIEGVREAASFIRPLIPSPRTCETDRFARSRSQHARARESLAGGVATHFRAAQLPVPISFAEGRSANVWDVDGNRYVDYALAFGPMLLGHSPAAVVEAVEQQLHAGIGYGASHRLEAELAEAICRTVPCAERAVISSTGSEAVHAALRIARSSTGRSRVVKFAGHYHGWLDPIHIGTPGHGPSEPGTSGQDRQAAANTLVCAWNDLAALDAVLTDDVAAVIMEPLNVNGGCIAPAPGYLEAVRELTRRRGALLVFDEVITGYRVALGGAQERFGVIPDLTVLGKALGGGFPISAVCGRRDVFDEVASGRVAHVGTFNANPVCAAAAVATIRELESGAREIYPRLRQASETLASMLEQEGADAGLPLVVNRDVGVAHGFVAPSPVNSSADAERADSSGYRALAGALLRHGVHVIPRGLLYVSTAHRDEHLEETRAAVRAAVRDVVREPSRRTPR